MGIFTRQLYLLSLCSVIQQVDPYSEKRGTERKEEGKRKCVLENEKKKIASLKTTPGKIYCRNQKYETINHTTPVALKITRRDIFIAIYR